MLAWACSSQQTLRKGGAQRSLFWSCSLQPAARSLVVTEVCVARSELQPEYDGSSQAVIFFQLISHEAIFSCIHERNFPHLPLQVLLVRFAYRFAVCDLRAVAGPGEVRGGSRLLGSTRLPGDDSSDAHHSAQAVSFRLDEVHTIA